MHPHTHTHTHTQAWHQQEEQGLKDRLTRLNAVLQEDSASESVSDAHYTHPSAAVYQASAHTQYVTV
jgi:hypothetical protein